MRTSFERIYTDDNFELAGLLYEPDVATDKILIHVHGMAGNFYENKFLDNIAQTLTDSGIAFFTFNNRGCELTKDLYKIVDGKRTIVRIGNDFERFDACVSDIKSAIDFVSKRGFSEIHLTGHSLGAPKVAYYICSTQDSRLKSLIFISPADMVGLAKDADEEKNTKLAKALVAENKGGELLPDLIWDEFYLSANTYLDLSSKESNAAIFNLYDPNDTLQKLSTITQPVLAIMGDKDAALTVPVSELMERLGKALKNSKEFKAYIPQGANHGYIGNEQDLADALKNWMVG